MGPEEFYRRHPELVAELELASLRARRHMRREARSRNRAQRGTRRPPSALLWLGIADAAFLVLHLCGAAGVWQGLAVAAMAAVGLWAVTGRLARRHRARSTATRREVPRG